MSVTLTRRLGVAGGVTLLSLALAGVGALTPANAGTRSWPCAGAPSGPAVSRTATVLSVKVTGYGKPHQCSLVRLAGSPGGPVWLVRPGTRITNLRGDELSLMDLLGHVDETVTAEGQLAKASTDGPGGFFPTRITLHPVG